MSMSKISPSLIKYLSKIGNHPVGICSWSLKKGRMSTLNMELQEMAITQIQLNLVPLINSKKEFEYVNSKQNSNQWHVISGMVEMIGEDYSTIQSIRNTGGVISDKYWKDNMNRFENACLVASRLGLGLVTMHAGFIPNEMSSNNYIKIKERIKTCTDIAQKYQLALGLETGQETANELLDFILSLDCSNLGINFDPANILLYGSGDPIKSFKQISHLVFQVHLKDAIASSIKDKWGHEVPVGEGEIDWKTFFRLLDKKAPTVPVIAERESGDCRKKDLVKALEYFSKIYKEI